MKPIPYGKQYISDNDIESVVSVLKSDFLTQGPLVAEFEQEFAKYIGSKYAIAVASGTAALHLSVLALGLNKNERVISSPITFAASTNCVLYAGGSVDFIDINSSSWTLDLNRVEDFLKKSKNTSRIRGIIPVDFSGYSVDLQELKGIVEPYGLWILEDACHAPGGYFTDSNSVIQMCGNGSFADLAIFSFHPVKHIATGEGGMITTNNKSLYNKILTLRTHGITKNQNDFIMDNHGPWYHEMQDLGFNYRLSDIHAALGKSQLSKASEGITKRNEIATFYRTALQGLPLKFQEVDQTKKNAYHLFVVLTKKRKELFDFLRGRRIYCQVHYLPVYKHPYYQNNGYSNIHLENAESYYSQCLSLPIFPSITNDELNYVVQSIKEFFNATEENIY